VAGETSSFTQTTITVTVGVQVGKTYRLKVKAQNKWGWGLFSNVVAVLAASTPSQMEAPFTSIDAATGKLKISWTQPDTRGSSITAYKIEVRNSLGSWIENTSQCNGAINPVLSNRYCMINMLDLYPADYFLAFQDLLVTRVFATN
jgi:hypothetical protein